MPSKARPRQTDRARDSATETPSKTRRDFFRRRTARRRSSHGLDRGYDSTEWRCQQHPSRGCSFADRQPQPSANVNHEYTRMNTNVLRSDPDHLATDSTDDADHTDKIKGRRSEGRG